MVRLTQMKWKGTVSHSPNMTIAIRFSIVKTPQPTSSHAPLGTSRLSRSSGIDTVSLTPDGDDGLGAELRSEPPDIDVHDVRARVEVIAPHVRQQPLLRDRLTRILHEFPQQEELPFGQRDQAGSSLRGPAEQVQAQAAGFERVRVPARRSDPCVHTERQLLEVEGLGHVVVRAQ